jgi:thimet oligopeptidase
MADRNRNRWMTLLTPTWLVLAVAGLAGGCASEKTTAKRDAAPAPQGVVVATEISSPDRFVREAGAFGDELIIPRFESTPEEVVRNVDRTIKDADAALDRLALQDPAFASFKSTIMALDDIGYPVVTAANRMSLMMNSDPDPTMRDAARGQALRLQNWFVSTQYREDIYRICKAYADAYEDGRRRALEGEDLKLFEETMRDYRRAGMNLGAETRAQVEELQKTLAELSTQFDANITNASVTVEFTKDELDGFSEEMLARYDTGDGTFALKATVTPEFIAVMQNASKEPARKKMKAARYSVVQEVNIPLLNEIVRVRDQIAALLGYETWADYQIETRMAGDLQTAMQFELDLAEGLEPKFRDEVEAMRQIKVAETGDPDSVIEHWDWRYYQNKVLLENFSVDVEAMRDYLPFDACLHGMFNAYESIFGLEFTQVENPDPWAEGVTLWVVSDAASGEPMGAFYLDMFPRDGKYNHFAQFDVIGGKRMANGVYRRPIAALLCNFTAPTDDKPSLISHDELQTLFHEFGHAMHTILTRAETARFAGTNVPRDFVEAPSQMLEAWTFEPEVLNSFAGHWQDPSKKIDPAVLERMEAARLATQGVHYRRQLALGIGDLRLHGEGASKDAQDIINQAFADVFLPVPEGTGMVAYWGHMTGYDAGYYGYAWADSIAADMQSVFRNAPNGFMDQEVGMRLREEIYAPGGSREIDESIEFFLGRPRSLDAFLESVGIEEP